MRKLRGAVLAVTTAGVCIAAGAQSGNESFYKNFLMPAVQLLDAERAHRFAVLLAKYQLVPRFPSSDRDRKLLQTNVWNMDFSSPVRF